MKTKVLKEIGIVGKQVEFTTQELIVIADLQDYLATKLAEEQERDSIRDLVISQESLQNVITLLYKMVGEVKGLHQTHAELFNLDEVNTNQH